MSLLTKQLQQIKNNQRAMKVAPQQQQPTLLFDPHTATTTSPDLIYTFSILSYSKLLTQQPQLKDEGQVVMGNQYKQINRNTLTKQVNRVLSEKLIKFMLKISPFFLGEDCQRVLQYLLHNFKVNIFEAESLAIIYLQYWNTPIYQKLISNIPDKLLSVKLPFLLKLNSQQPHNLTYIVKSLAYSHFLMSSIVMYTLQYLKIQGFQNTMMDIEINLGDQIMEERESIVKCDPRRFLLQIFSEFVSRQMVNCYKYIIDFCVKAIRPNQQVSAETCSMVMLLTTRLLLQQLISEELISALLIKLLKNSYFHNERAQQQLFDFTLIVWQRKPACITQLVIPYLQSSQNFIKYLSQFKCSLWMILVRLLQLWSERVECKLLLVCVGGRVKESEFYVLHKEQYLIKLFQFFNRIVEEQINRQELPFLQNWFYENFAYELAVYYHKKPIVSELLKQMLVNMFQKQFLTISKSGHFIFNVALIPKKIIVVEKPSQRVEEANSSEEDNQQQQIQEGQKKQSSSLITLLRHKGMQLKVINYSDQQTKSNLLELVSQFYSQGSHSKITQKQKNEIMQQYLPSYTDQWFLNDIQLKDFSTPIKYLSQTSDLSKSMRVLLHIEVDLAIMDDVLFRQLFRLSLSQVTAALPSQYKQTIYFLNTFFKNLMRKYIGDITEPTQLLKLSEILLKVSSTVFGKNGIRKGKFHRLLHSHGRVIAELIIRLKSKQTASKHLAAYERSILDHYMTTLKTYSKDNAYLLNIGIVEILTRKTMDHNHIKYFINKVILKTIHEAGLDCHDLIFSLAKTLVFCSQFGPTISLDQSEIEPSLCSGIAKSVLADFFGLIKDKFRRVLVKKLLLFIRSIFESNNFIEYFKNHLFELPSQDLTALLSLFTEFYKILSLLVSEDAQVQQFKVTIMDKITNIFPLNLRLVLFESLLPNQQLYAYLANQLEEHSPERSQFQQLATLINIVPQSVTFQWVKFIRECLKRGYQPSASLLNSVFANYSTESNVNSYSQLICDFAEFCPELLYAHLPASIEIIESHCNEPNNFTLALVSRIIRSLGEMIDPYLSKLVLASLSFDSPYTQTFIIEVTNHLVPSTLIKLIKQNYKEATHISNFCHFFKEVAIKGIGSSLNKTLLNFMGRTLMAYLESEQHPGKVVELQSQIFLQIGLKMNENELRKAIIDLVRWSETKSEIEESLPFNLRKIIVAKTYCLLAENLKGLFNPFFGYTFEATLKDYTAITQYFEVNANPSKIGNGLKRNREQPKQQQHELIELYLRNSLKSFRLLFDNDTDHQFLDSVKIESLGEPISELILMAQFQRYGAFISQDLIPSLISLHRCIVDDYQMKTINYKILLLLKKKNGKIQKAVFELIDGLVQVLQDRFLVLVGDLVPFLLEWAGSRHEGISKIVRRVIAKIEEISGEAIQNYAK